MGVDQEEAIRRIASGAVFPIPENFPEIYGCQRPNGLGQFMDFRSIGMRKIVLGSPEPQEFVHESSEQMVGRLRPGTGSCGRRRRPQPQQQDSNWVQFEDMVRPLRL